MLICEGLFFIVGLIAVITGKFKLTRNRLVTGSRARSVGAILMMPPVFGGLAGLALGATVGDTYEVLIVVTIFELALLVFAFVYAVNATSNVAEKESSISAPTTQVYSVAEAADYLKVPEQEVLRLIQDGALSARRIGQHYRIAQRALTAFLTSY